MQSQEVFYGFPLHKLNSYPNERWLRVLCKYHMLPYKLYQSNIHKIYWYLQLYRLYLGYCW